MGRRLILHAILILVSTTLFGQIQVIKTKIYFEVNQSKVNADGIKALDKTLDSLSHSDILKVIVKGNSDNVGADSLYNLILSQKRADSVCAYLIGKKVAAKVITKSFYGGDKPIADNSTEEGRRLNRRVEVLISYQSKLKSVVDTSDNVIDMIVKAPKVTDPRDSIISQWRNRWGWFLGCGGVRGGRDCWDIFRSIDSLNPPTKDSITLTADSLGSILDFASFKIDTVPNCIRDTQRCKNVPFQVLIPVTKDVAQLKTLLKSVQLFEGIDGNWQPSAESISIVKSGGRDCIELLVHCARTWFSCRIVDPYDVMVKVRVPRKYAIRSFFSWYDQPFMMTVANKTTISNMTNAKLINMTHPGQFKLKLVDKKGKALDITLPIQDVIGKEQLTNVFKTVVTGAKPNTARGKVYRIKGRMIREALTRDSK